MSRNADVSDKVRTLIMEDRHLPIREIADKVLQHFVCSR
jgi:hypothetical protein